MGLTIHLIAVLAALIATHTVQGLHFPRGKTLVYKYYADVKAGTIEPAAYASQFSVEGTLYIKHDIRDRTLKNAYYVALRDVKTGMYNGAATYHHHIDVVNPIEDAAKLLEEPFLINYNENGGLQGIRIPASTQGWHKNMKMAMASMLQLDFTKINVKTWEQRQNFISKENTIYGNCSVTYDVFPKGEYPTKEFVIMKFFSPINCTNFYSDSFNHVDVDDCPTHKDDSLNVDSKRVVEIEKDGEEIIIKKLYAHGGVNYLPWNRRSKVHYVLTNATFNLERMAPASEIELPWVDLENAPVVDDLTYQPPTLACMTDAVIDLTQGRHKYHANHAVAELKKLLKEAVDYSEENHLKIGVPNWKHGQIINRIYNKMSCMNERLLEMVYDFYQDSKIPRDIAMKNLFLGIIPQVGTPATFGFVQRMISENKFPEATAIDMLNKLTVRPVPILRMFWMLERLLTFTESVPVAVKKAGILSFSSLLYRTFKDVPHAENDLILHRYLDYFFNQITNGTTYEMKVVHLMAIRNIEIGNIYDVLAPIIKGDLTIAENPMNFRLLAIWAVEKAIVKDYVAADKLLWPIMTDSSLPVKLRIAAYEILINIPNEVLLRRIDWFMIGENNDHLYNYHYTTIRNIASSEEPCKSTLREHIRKIIRFNKKHENTHYTLSASYAYNDYDQFFEFVEKLHGGLVLDDRNGVPEVLRFDGSLVRGPEAVVDVGMRLHIEGLGDILNEKMYSLFVNPERLMNTKVLEVLMEAARDFPPAADIYVDIIMMHNGRVILANHYNRETLSKIYDDVSTYIIIQQQDGLNEYHQSIRYDHLSQKQMINDMGLPVLLESKVPVVAFMKINYKPKITEDLLETAFDWGVELQIWRHGEYTMSTYNPISDAWHAMKRITAIDASLPIYENVTIDFKMKSVKISFPSYVGSKLPIAGIRLYIKDLVTIDADHGNKALKKSCSTCSLHEEVGNDKFRKIKFNTSYDSALSGLKYTLSVLNCELEGQPMMSDLYGTVKPPRDDPWDDWIDEKKIITHQKMKSMLLYPQVGNCGILLKLEPSPQYPPSTINFNLRANMEVDGDDNPWFYRLTPEKYEFIGSAELIPGSANVSVMTFGIKTSVHMNEGHLLNTAKLELSHKMPGERIFKICVNAQKSYPPVPSDPLNRTLSRQETHTIITAASGYLDDDDATCQRESTMLTLTMVGELSDEQKNKFDKDYASGLCTNDMKNPLYENSTEILPLTENCLNEVITYTTLRKYTIIMEHAWLREEDLFVMFNYYENNLRSILSPYLKLNFEIIDPTHVKIIAEVPMQKYATDDKNNHITIEPWLSGFHLTDVKDINDNVVKPLWWAPLDNTRFTYNFLWEYTNSEIKMCSVQPQITMTADYKNFAFTIPQKWTLITGDHGTKLFAIFAKSVGENLATRIYVGNHAIEIMPRPEKSIQLTIDDSDVVLDGKSESRFIRDLYLTIARVTKNKDLVIIEFTQIPSLTMVYSPKQITLTINKFMSKGRVSGLCGHLDGSYYRTNVTEIYTLDDD